MSRSWDPGITGISATTMAPLNVLKIPKSDLALRRVTNETGTYELPATPIDQPCRLVLQRKPNADIYAGTGFQKNAQFPNKTGSDLTVSLWATGKSECENEECCDTPWFNNYGVSVTFHKVPNTYLDENDVMNAEFTNLLSLLIGTISTVPASSVNDDPDEQLLDVMKLARGILDPASY